MAEKQEKPEGPVVTLRKQGEKEQQLPAYEYERIRELRRQGWDLVEEPQG